MSEKKAAFLHCSQLEQLPYPDGCPFNTSRAGKVRQVISSMGLLGGSNTAEVEPVAADRMMLKKFHTPKYLKVLKNADAGKFEAEALYMGLGTPDCPIFNGMYEYSALACGASLKGVELILSGEAFYAFNPSGGLHHAQPDRAAGFCYMNDVALACMVLAQDGKRILYFDVDVHHGDGVQDAFYDRNDVITISFHQSGRTLFPGTGFVEDIGAGKGKGYSVNVPLPVGTYDELYMKAFLQIVPPLFEKFNPDVVVFELGADTLAGDPLAQIYLTNNVHVEIIKRLLKFDRPILMTGGGGYNIENTVRTWSLAWSVLCRADDEHDMNIGLRDRLLVPTEQQVTTVAPAMETVIKQVKEIIFPLHGI